MARPPNIILFITDQQRAEAFGAPGTSWTRAPAPDRLAREGTAFTNGFVMSPVCTGSREPLHRDVSARRRRVHEFTPREPTWVRRLAQAGCHCSAAAQGTS
jgi:hypothetical protein